MSETRVFTLYTRLACHLCDDMQVGLRTLQTKYHFNFQTVDIDSSAELVERYGLAIPVLTEGDTEVCRYHLDEAALVRQLQKPRI